MTNFEKWRNNLTPEAIIEIIKQELTPQDMWFLWCHKYFLTEEAFNEWANEEVSEEP